MYSLPSLLRAGERDAMISCEWGRQTASNLLLRDVDVQFRTYPGVGHDLSPAEVTCLILFSHVLYNPAMRLCWCCSTCWNVHT